MLGIYDDDSRLIEPGRGFLSNASKRRHGRADPHRLEGSQDTDTYNLEAEMNKCAERSSSDGNAHLDKHLAYLALLKSAVLNLIFK
jgi:hypothetical protein